MTSHPTPSAAACRWCSAGCVRAYPDAAIALSFRTPWELLVATVLSAQCTDERVNQVTPGLFAAYPDPEAFAVADQAELARAIYPTGYHNRRPAHSVARAA